MSGVSAGRSVLSRSRPSDGPNSTEGSSIGTSSWIPTGFKWNIARTTKATRQVAPALRRLYDAVPAPKRVFAIGSCATGGGCWFDSYNVLGGADKVVPVDIYVPGCPPRPEAILYGVGVALGLLPKKVAPEDYRQETLEELAQGRSSLTGAQP